MKVFHVNVVANSRSTGRIVEGIVSLAQEKSYQSFVAYGRWANASKSVLFKVGNLVDTLVHVVITRLFDKHGLGSGFATRKLVKYIDKVKPDIIHLHNIHGYYLNYPILFNYLAQADIPVVWTLHDCWAYTGHCVYYTACGCEKWRKQCFKCPNLKDYPQSLLMDSSKSNFQSKKKYFTKLKRMTIVTVSEWLASQVKDSFLNNYEIKTIHNGLDVSTFLPQSVTKSEYGWEGKHIILGVASEWSTRKGLDDFMKLSRHLDKNDLIVLVGLNEEQQNGLPSNIVGLGKTDSVQALARLYSVADVYLNFSVEETFGMTTIESMACGTPVVVVNSTASPELVNENVGFVIEPHDIAKAVEVINIVKKNGKTAYSEACRSYVLDNFNEIDRFNEYIDLYDNIIACE